LLGALGEGENAEFDQSPLYRTDAFDCVTFVNTILSLLFSANLIEFKYHLSRINYHNGRVRYQHRHHFMSVDWNPANVINGYIRDISNEFCDQHGNAFYEVAYAYINKPKWFEFRNVGDIKFPYLLEPAELEKKLNALQSLSDFSHANHAYTPFLPLKRMFNINGEPLVEIFRQFPSSALIEVVRPNWDLKTKIGTNMNISHVGFLFRKNEALIFRHASQAQKKVVDELFVDYVKKYLESDTVKGISVFKILNSI
jgi:hypothetical protein